MERVAKDDVREERIHQEALVDAYGEEERAMGWYYYLADNIQFPFRAECVAERGTSPLTLGERVRAQGMAPEDECLREMFVQITAHTRTFGVPLAQLRPLDVDDETREAVEDWRYWVARGYSF